ncbi:hypothetical protein WA1_26235 [Scytonema hofmannii PCC 7110]|uniref:DUF2281 domain-containing protein n=1 Tax=Scytonema hofmannii PCC 7110 TaxID=128403 RepID=A0A139X7E6_9CYAN|nr:hypothetical protein [Scytonema hofmannii]KYC40617.1 hypothetical protein WA1_26235 [Scytonema hofmannii PCC 7110]
MNTHLSFQTIIESIEALSEEDQALLFAQIHQRKVDKQHQENGSEADKSTKSDNPWIRIAGKYQDDSDYDEVDKLVSVLI